jgi:cyanophycin synthetase
LPLLAAAGIPLPVQDLEFMRRNQVRRAQRSAQRVGYPVTVRPTDSQPHAYYFNESDVFGPLSDASQVEHAVNFLREEQGADVWVESHVAGDQYNFLVLGKEIIAVVRSTPPVITGDGEHSIAWLANRQAQQATNAVDYRVWTALAGGDPGENCRLQLSGLTVASVPEQGAQLALRAAGTFYNGGSCEDVIAAMPDAFKAVALEAAEVSGLSRLAGIDMVIDDLCGEPVAPNCAVTAVVPDPDLQIFARPAAGDPHKVAERFLRQLFPAGDQGRIPIVAITGTNGKTTTCRMLAHILRQAGHTTGLACSDGVYLDGERVYGGDGAFTRGAFWIFSDLRITVAVLETARGGMVSTGIAFDQCDVGACLNIAADHIGLNDINSLDEMAVHKRQVIERTTGTAVLNAEDPRCLAMRDHTQAQHIVLVGRSAAHPAVTSHCEAGGTAIIIDPPGADGNLCICDSAGITPLLALAEIPATCKGTAFYNAENAQFATAAALGLGLSGEVIAAGLRNFSMSRADAPGRLNVFEGLPFQVIVDYAHNAHGIKAFCEFSNRLAVEGRRILVFVVAGDKRVAEIEATAAAAAGSFDYFLCREPSELRGRKPGQITRLLKDSLMKNGVPGERVEQFPDQARALERALDMVESGDLLVVFAGKFHTDAWNTLERYRDTLQHDCTVH